jgi:hypothetical protein
MIASPKTNEQLMTRAQELIDSHLGERDDPNEFVPLWYKRCRTKVNLILGSMLACSYDCGGGGSQRYVSCAIIACTGGTKSSEDTHRALTELAISWFANFLWICKSLLRWSFYVENEMISCIVKANSSYSTQGITPIASDRSTPTLPLTQLLHATGGASVHRSSTMRDIVCRIIHYIDTSLSGFQVLARDGRTCPITGMVDTSVKTAPNTAKLHCAHILKRAVAVFPPADSMSPADKNKVSPQPFLLFNTIYLSQIQASFRDEYFGHFGTLHKHKP